jgi:cell division protein ZapA
VGHVAVTLNRRTYRLECGDGEEPRLLGLAAHLRAKLDGLVAEFGQVGDDRLMLLAALQIADELWEARDQVTTLTQAMNGPPVITQVTPPVAHADAPSYTPPLPAGARRAGQKG